MPCGLWAERLGGAKLVGEPPKRRAFALYSPENKRPRGMGLCGGGWEVRPCFVDWWDRETVIEKNIRAFEFLFSGRYGHHGTSLLPSGWHPSFPARCADLVP